MVDDLKPSGDEAVLKFYQKICALEIGLLLGSFNYIFYVSSGIYRLYFC